MPNTYDDMNTYADRAGQRRIHEVHKSCFMLHGHSTSQACVNAFCMLGFARVFYPCLHMLLAVGGLVVGPLQSVYVREGPWRRPPNAVCMGMDWMCKCSLHGHGLDVQMQFAWAWYTENLIGFPPSVVL